MKNKTGTIDLLQTFTIDKSTFKNSINTKLFNTNTARNNSIPSKFKNQGLVTEVNKIIKTPALNISSKLDSKGKLNIKIGNRSININFFDKQMVNSIDNKISSEPQIFDNKISKVDNEKDNKINIKLNINSEVINNNINIKNEEQISSPNIVKNLEVL